jgi:hypothetical protein
MACSDLPSPLSSSAYSVTQNLKILLLMEHLGSFILVFSFFSAGAFIPIKSEAKISALVPTGEPGLEQHPLNPCCCYNIKDKCSSLASVLGRTPTQGHTSHTRGQQVADPSLLPFLILSFLPSFPSFLLSRPRKYSLISHMSLPFQNRPECKCHTQSQKWCLNYLFSFITVIEAPIG